MGLNPPFKPCSNHDHPLAVSRKRGIVRQQVHPLAQALRDQQAVERVAVVEWQVAV